MTIKEIIETIDISKRITKGVEFYDMCQTQFQIYDYFIQPEHTERLTYCYYHRWICTDTEVGIRVWYFDFVPVCVSWKPYRKSSETYGWISKEDFCKVRDYVISLKVEDDEDDDVDVVIVDDECINKVIEDFNSIDYKKYEERNKVLDNLNPRL
jgi:hypothetical protein